MKLLPRTALVASLFVAACGGADETSVSDPPTEPGPGTEPGTEPGTTDTPLPKPPERVHIMEGSAAPWVDIPRGANDVHFDEYPEESIAAWHLRHGLVDQ